MSSTTTGSATPLGSPTTTSYTGTSVSSAAASTSTSSSNNDVSSPGTFYKNLFYILIGLLCAFGLISFLSLLRARHRRNRIVHEAERLGVLVPGVPGYVPMRDRQSLTTWARADGSENPDWWEVTGKKDAREEGEAPPRSEVPTLTDEDDFLPLAIIPPRLAPAEEAPVPHSDLPFFPNHLAYRPSSLLPLPARFATNQPETLNELAGDLVAVITIIRMPGQPWPADMEVEESQEVLHGWGGVELGIANMEVKGPKVGR